MFGSGGGRWPATWKPYKEWPSVAGQHVLEAQFLFFELVEFDVVRVGAVFFFDNQRFERGVLVLEGMKMSLIHRRGSFL